MAIHADRRLSLPLLLSALFFSGVAAIVNQTVWQRALKIYLAGVETSSSMFVILAFMAGLGLGSLAVGLRSSRIRNPLAALAAVEFALVVVNVSIAWALHHDVADSVYAFQRFALSSGVPLRVVYGLTACSTLFVPCVLMGMTTPLAADAAKRQLGATSGRTVVLVIVVNTVGSFAGGVLSGFFLLPHFGQLTTLELAVGANALAALALAVLAIRAADRQDTSEGAEPEAVTFRRGPFTRDEVLGFWFGVLSLAYEVYLFRAYAIRHEPMPTTFTFVLVSFLAWWSAGLVAAQFLPDVLDELLLLTALSLAGVTIVHRTMFVPCIFLGCAFGQLAARVEGRWGRAVGWLYALNTFGCCLGVIAATLVGYEVHPDYIPLGLAIAYVWLAWSSPSRLRVSWRRWTRRGLQFAMVAVVVLVTIRASKDWISRRGRSDRSGQATAYYGADGAIEIDQVGDLLRDGLWHSRLAYDGGQIGTSNWLIAVIPWLCHAGGRLDDTLVIGLGTGVTASTLARSDRVGHVDVYEIDRTLTNVLRDFPEGTLHVSTDPKVRIRWQDGRSGLALNEERYDLITQQPMYLRHAGSSLLLSKEYLQLVKHRLKPGGVFALYSNAIGVDEEALLVRRTIADVFPYYESFESGYMVVASNEPFRFVAEAATTSSDRVAAQIRRWGAARVPALLDSPRLNWMDCPFVITDDHPLVEYPDIARAMVGGAGRRTN